VSSATVTGGTSNLTVNAANGATFGGGSVGGGLTVDGGAGAATVGSGAVGVGSLFAIGDNVAISGVVTSGGSVNLTGTNNTATAINQTAAITAATGNVSMLASNNGGVTTAANITATTGGVSITATNGALAGSANITGAGAVTLTAGTGVTFTGTRTITANSDMTDGEDLTIATTSGGVTGGTTTLTASGTGADVTVNGGTGAASITTINAGGAAAVDIRIVGISADAIRASAGDEPLGEFGVGIGQCAGEPQAFYWRAPAEVDIDALGTDFLEGLRHVRLLVVDARVEPEFLDHVIALGLGARQADDAASLDARDLPDDLPDGTRRCRHDNRFTRLGLSDVHEAEIGRRAREAERAHVGRHRNARQARELARGHGA
jgi:hypothetical protein